MRRFTKIVSVFCLAAILAALPATGAFAEATAWEEDQGATTGTMAADLFGARPIGLVATVVGFAGFIIALPFSLPGGNAGKVWETVVEEPAAYTFARPLGEFD